MLILPLSCFNLRWQATCQVITDCIKAVKDRHNALLFLNGRHWQIYLSQSFSTHMRNACATLHTIQFSFFILKRIVQIFWYCNFFLCFISKAVRDKNRFIPVRNKSSRCTASSHCDNFADVVSTVNIICWFLSAQNHGNITSFFVFLSDILATKNICNFTQRQHSIAKYIPQELNQRSVPFRSVPFRSVPFRSVPFRSKLCCRFLQMSRAYLGNTRTASAGLRFQRANQC